MSILATTVTKARNDATFVSKARANLTFKMQDTTTEEPAHSPSSPARSRQMYEASGDDAAAVVKAEATSGESETQAAPSAVGPRPAVPESRKPPAPSPTVEVFKTQAMHPTALVLDLPADLQPGEASAWVEGPHGALKVPVPSGAGPGDFVQVHIGPKRDDERSAVVAGDENADPQDAWKKEDDSIQFLTKECAWSDEPVLMVRVPEGTGGGDWVSFAVPTDDGAEDEAETEACRMAQVPNGAQEGSYFEVPLGMQSI